MMTNKAFYLRCVFVVLCCHIALPALAADADMDGVDDAVDSCVGGAIGTGSGPRQ